MDQNQESSLTALDYVRIGVTVSAYAYCAYFIVHSHLEEKRWRKSLKQNMKNHSEN